jgi:hypothetical protein
VCLKNSEPTEFQIPQAATYQVAKATSHENDVSRQSSNPEEGSSDRERKDRSDVEKIWKKCLKLKVDAFSIIKRHLSKHTGVKIYIF